MTQHQGVSTKIGDPGLTVSGGLVVRYVDMEPRQNITNAPSHEHRLWRRFGGSFGVGSGFGRGEDAGEGRELCAAGTESYVAELNGGTFRCSQLNMLRAPFHSRLASSNAHLDHRLHPHIQARNSHSGRQPAPKLHENNFTVHYFAERPICPNWGRLVLSNLRTAKVYQLTV